MSLGAFPQLVITKKNYVCAQKNDVSMGNITSSITFPAEKIAKGSPIFANKWRIRKTDAKKIYNKKLGDDFFLFLGGFGVSHLSPKTTTGPEDIFPEE